jgi:circadian clock protein KaiC
MKEVEKIPKANIERAESIFSVKKNVVTKPKVLKKVVSKRKKKNKIVEKKVEKEVRKSVAQKKKIKKKVKKSVAVREIKKENKAVGIVKKNAVMKRVVKIKKIPKKNSEKISKPNKKTKRLVAMFSKSPTKIGNSKSIGPIERVPTGIVNLDKIIEGGLEKNSTNLLVGGSGNGKSIFATQFLIEGLKRGEAVLYVSFEEKKEEFYTNILELGWDLQKAEREGRFFFLSYTPEKIRTMLEEGGGDIETIVLTKKIQRIAIDSITAFVMLFDKDIEMREKTLALFSLLRSWTCTSLLIYERDPLIDKRESSRILEFEADSLILLYFTRIKKERERFLEVYKMRGTNHSTNIYPYKIRTQVGVDVSSKPYPGSLHKFQVK